MVLKRTDGDGITKRKGKIVSWVGKTISIETPTGIRKTDSDRLIRIETAWDPAYKTGEKFLAANDIRNATEQFLSAVDGEQRQWMKNIVLAKLLECSLAQGAWDESAAAFLNINQTDPQSRFLHLIPLVWTSSRPPQASLKLAKQWIESSDPNVKLLGASWLLETERDQATEVMRELSQHRDPRIAALATGQLWRRERVAIGEKRVVQRVKKVLAMPASCRAGAWYQIALTRSRDENDSSRRKAVIDWIRIVSNEPQQRGLCAASLYQSNQVLKQLGRTKDAARLLLELKEKFGDSTWANE